MINKRNKSAQEEIMGFVIIVVIVSVILLILLSFLIKPSKKSSVESYEVESFINSILQYTSECEDYVGYLSVQNLIAACENKGKCLNQKESCDILNETLNAQIREGWNVREQSAVKGYRLQIFADKENRLVLIGGNRTINYKGDFQDFAKRGKNYEILLDIYY